MPGGAPLRNQNAANAKRWKAAIERAISRQSRVEGQIELDALADEFVAAVRRGAEKGDIGGFRELGDRLDGKATQQTEISGPGGAPLTVVLQQADDTA